MAVISGGTLVDLPYPSGVGPGVNVGFGIPLQPGIGFSFDAVRDDLAAVRPLEVWGSQPSIRKVVEFIARNVASTPLKVYRRVSDQDRQRLTDHPLAKVLASPYPRVTPYDFWFSVVVDWLLWDRWCVLKTPPADVSGILTLTRLQAARLQFKDDGFGRVTGVWVDGRTLVPAEDCVIGKGYAPMSGGGTSPILTLASILRESREAVDYRREIWRRGARAPVVITRPAAAPVWQPGDRDRFLRGWRQFARGGGREGGTPILQDGMDVKKIDAFSPRDAQEVEARQLTDVEVASAYHVAPELVGARQGNYSNVQAFNEMLYGPSLGPYFTAIEQAINAMLTTEYDDPSIYVEFDIDAKLRGTFDQQAQILSTAVGAPWMTRAEARGRVNLPQIAGSDALIVPLNVIEGGQASPRDSGSQNRNARMPQVKAAITDRQRERIAQVLSDFARKQGDAVLPKIGSGDWWDADHWDTELAGALSSVSHAVASILGPVAAGKLGYPDGYDPDLTVNFLKAVAARYAHNINATTKAELDAQLAADEPDPAYVFDKAADSRAKGSSVGIGTFVAAFATVEAGRQIARSTGRHAVKTWITGPKPRASHAAMDGETVPIDDAFSNGANWPCDSGDPADSGCNCTSTVSFE